MPITRSFTGFGDAPTVIAASAIGLRLIRVSFSEAMRNDADLVDPANYALTPNGGSVARNVSTVTAASDRTYVALTVDGDLSVGVDAYTIQVSSVADAASNPIGSPDSADVTVVAPDTTLEVNSDGGEVVSFELGLPDGEYYVDVGVDPEDSAERAYSARSGHANDCLSRDGVLTFAVPRVTPAENYRALVTPVNGDPATLTSVLFHARRRPLFSATHALRKILPWRWRTGPKKAETEIVE